MRIHSRAHRVFLTVLAFAYVSTCVAPGQQHMKLSATWKCSFDGRHTNNSVYTFDSDDRAENAVLAIIRFTGLAKNFVIRAADVPNAVAMIENQERYILYSHKFMLRLADEARTDWAATGVMAHEIGHHLLGHTLFTSGSAPEAELQADRYAGFIMQRMGASLVQSTAAWDTLSDIEETETHPAKASRVTAVTNGWIASRDLKPLPNPPEVRAHSGEGWFIATRWRGDSSREQVYKFVSRLPSPDIRQYWDAGYSITGIAAGSGRWAVVLTKGAYGAQSFYVSAEWPKEYIKEYWDKGYRITWVGTDEKDWAVVMSKSAGKGSQKWHTEAAFPKDYIRKEWSADRYVTALSRSGSTYAVITDEIPSYKDQEYSCGKGMHMDYVKKKWSEGFILTTAVPTSDGNWCMVMTKTDASRSPGESYWLTTDFPHDWVKKEWEKNFEISLLY